MSLQKHRKGIAWLCMHNACALNSPAAPLLALVALPPFVTAMSLQGSALRSEAQLQHNPLLLQLSFLPFWGNGSVEHTWQDLLGAPFLE